MLSGATLQSFKVKVRNQTVFSLCTSNSCIMRIMEWDAVHEISLMAYSRMNNCLTFYSPYNVTSLTSLSD